MSDIWNTRYTSKEYIYGSLPNEYFKLKFDKLPAGKLFLPAEGEGRNAVYAAKLGWKILAVDSSEVGKEKALKLASENKVDILYDISDFVSYQYPVNVYDAAGIIFALFPSETRTLVYKAIAGPIKKGGIIILETFSKKQFGKTSGEPQNLDMLNSIDELKSDFTGFDFIESTETQV